MGKPRVWNFFESDEYVVDRPETMGLKSFVEKSAYDELVKKLADGAGHLTTTLLERNEMVRENEALKEMLEQKQKIIGAMDREIVLRGGNFDFQAVVSKSGSEK